MIVFFQARNIETGALAAVKIIKLEPGKTHLPSVSSCLSLHLNTVFFVRAGKNKLWSVTHFFAYMLHLKRENFKKC